jgi:competence protein ComEA
MRKSLHIVLTTFIVLTIAAGSFAAETSTAAPASASGVVNINTADAAQLAYLPRVGVKAAQRIIDYRKEHGPFRKTTDLMQVKGFGEKTLTRLSPYLAVDGKTTLDAKVQSPRKPRSAKASKSRPTSSQTAG